MKKFRTFGYFCLPLLVLLLSGCIHISGHRLYLETDWRKEFGYRVETEHFIFYVSGGEKVDTEAQERFYAYITELFGVKPEEKIIYMKCRDSKHAGRLVGAKNFSEITEAITIEYRTKRGVLVPAIISTEKWENHEVVHVFQKLISESTVFFREGLAVAYQIDPSSNIYYPHERQFYHKLIQYHRMLMQQIPSLKEMEVPHINHWLQNQIIGRGEYIGLGEILTTPDFMSLGIQTSQSGDYYKRGIAYLEAGSFVRYIIDRYGLEKFFQFLKLSDYLDSKELTEEKFLKIYDISIQEMEKQWLDFLKENY